MSVAVVYVALAYREPLLPTFFGKLDVFNRRAGMKSVAAIAVRWAAPLNKKGRRTAHNQTM